MWEPLSSIPVVSRKASKTFHVSKKLANFIFLCCLLLFYIVFIIFSIDCQFLSCRDYTSYVSTHRSFIYLNWYIMCYVLSPSLAGKTEQTQPRPIATPHSLPPRVRTGGNIHTTQTTQGHKFSKSDRIGIVGDCNGVT